MRGSRAWIIPILAEFPDSGNDEGRLAAALNFVGPALVIAFRVQLGCYPESC
jgi:hypothetical protein